jgi:predicted transcriptional regulator
MDRSNGFAVGSSILGQPPTNNSEDFSMATSVKLDDDLKKRIQHLADSRQRSAHWIMREAIRDYVAREEAREDFKKESLASWKAYQETGRHLTGQEVHKWLNAWGTDEEQEIPPCHE